MYSILFEHISSLYIHVAYQIMKYSYAVIDCLLLIAATATVVQALHDEWKQN